MTGGAALACRFRVLEPSHLLGSFFIFLSHAEQGELQPLIAGWCSEMAAPCRLPQKVFGFFFR
jgi:hypothetical protein